MGGEFEGLSSALTCKWVGNSKGVVTGNHAVTSKWVENLMGLVSG